MLTCGVASIVEKRRFVGAEILEDYHVIASNRIKDAVEGKAKIRDDVPVAESEAFYNNIVERSRLLVQSASLRMKL